MSFLFHIGRYAMFVRQVFGRPVKHRIFFKQVIREMDVLGLSSVGIVVIISFFMGAVITLQTAYNIDLPIIPKYAIGLAARDSIILEFSSTIVSLILAGKVGSHIASEIGTMRVTEQIDVLDVMGINSAGYLVLPKVMALIIIIPFLVIISMGVGIFGGWTAGTTTGVVPSDEYIYGIQYMFVPFYIAYSLIKSVVFAFLITTIAGYWGYYSTGGSLEVGRSSTRAVVISSIQILLFNLILTQLLLA
ncbi:MlaE family ABC transporter permease [Natronoflexus pectinivorans]|uniref:Phospholipid/cholesterol/gamma-HCH transport system permease protein n=1 Tax=Natronoflexus pectinivorans TaxID=682526 RepID=A0A4R2GIT3_9BACT|nr:ABC transporter permease [Natronoflexus pectinivorans]TCO08203.1 phospholipid/cholesterol/gamma-HCH transport system permease protein [Natronoflexus pectinivorans]